MTVTISPAVRQNTPLIIGIAGPSKSGKTYSAHRLARGLAGDGLIVMINAEGARGHQYADKFKYSACDIAPPYSYTRYDEALEEIAKLNPACVIVDSVSHAHDGPGGMIEEHDKEVERRAGNDYKKRERVTWAAWIKPKEAENKFIYRMLGTDCPIILCFRAKEKLKIVPGQDPVDLGYQPIASDRIAFETLFSLMLSPRSKGVPDLSLSDMREPFEDFLKPGEPIDEQLGERLAVWAEGVKNAVLITAEQVRALQDECLRVGVSVDKLLAKAEVRSLAEIESGDFDRALAWISKHRPMTDEAAILVKIDKAKDRDAAAEILDAIPRDTPLHASASTAYTNRWGAQ